MKKYAIILNGQIATTYEAESPQVFGGPWGSEDAQHLEIPENYDLNLLTWNGEELGQRQLSEQEILTKTIQEAKNKAVKNKADIEFGLQIIAIVGSLNEEKNLSHEQKNSMMADSYVSTVMLMLQAGRIGYAKQLIESYTPMEVYFTTQDKELILDVINDYLS